MRSQHTTKSPNPQHASTTETPLRQHTIPDARPTSTTETPLPPPRSQVLTFFSRRLRASAVTSKTSPRDLRPSAPPRQNTNLPRVAAVVLLSFSLVFAQQTPPVQNPPTSGGGVKFSTIS